MLVETSGDETPTLPAGFSQVEGSPIVDIADATGSKLSIAYRFRQRAVPALTVTGTTNHVLARIYTFRGCLDRMGGPRVVSSNAITTPSTTFTWADGSVPANSRIVLIVADPVNINSTGQWNNTLTSVGNLTSVASQAEVYTTTGNGGRITMWHGLCSASTIGTVTATTVTSRTACGIVLALEPKQVIGD